MKETTFILLFNIIWITTLVGALYTGIRGFILYITIRKKQEPGNEWRGTARIKDLQKLEQSTTDENLKLKVHKTIGYLTTSKMITQMGLLLMLLLIMGNTFFKGK